MEDNKISKILNDNFRMGIRSYKVFLDPNCCQKCENFFKEGNVWFDIDDVYYFTPLHPNCGCIVVYSIKTAVENNCFGEKDLNSLEEKYSVSPEISDKTKEYIWNFTDENSTSINNAFMAKAKGFNYDERYYNICETMNQALLSNGHRLKENTFLWRGEDDLYIKSLKVGEVYEWNKLTSTSFDKNVAKKFQGDKG